MPFSAWDSLVLENARIQAFRPPIVAPSPIGFHGGLMLDDDPEHLKLRHQRDGKPVDHLRASFESEEFIAGEYIYAGPIWNHFGHFMAEMVHRIVPAQELFGNVPLLFVTHEGDTFYESDRSLPSFMAEAFRLLDVNPSSVRFINRDVIVEKVFVVEQGAQLGRMPYPEYLKALRERVHKHVVRSETAGKIYVSRSRISSGGIFLGERIIEEMFESAGFKIFHPQDFSFVDQISIYYNSDAVVFSQGSSCHGVELLGDKALKHALFIANRPMGSRIFENILEPRSEKFSILPGCHPVGSYIMNRVTGDVSDHASAAIFNIKQIERVMDDLGFNRSSSIELKRYKECCRNDLITRLSFHVDSGHALVGSEYIGAIFNDLDNKIDCL